MASPGPTMPQKTGESFVQVARQHVGEKYLLGVLVPKNTPRWKGLWDCSEFASWAVYQAAASNYGCNSDDGDPASADAFTGYWERDAKNLGEIIPIEQAARTPGAAVLRIPQVRATGHIVTSDGVGVTVEAPSSKVVVIQSTLTYRRWDTGILIPGMAYTRGSVFSVPPHNTVIFRLTLPMMTGEKVRQIQGALGAAGFDPGSIDGEFGPHTEAAVVAFQLSNGLLPDGEVGSRTAAALGVQL